MTQVANLTAGMSVQSKSDAAYLKHDQSQSAIEEFAGIMNRNTQSFMNPQVNFVTRSGDTSDDKASMSENANTAQKDYEKFGSSNSRRITQAQSEHADPEAVSHKLQELADNVKETVRETMQVTEEDLAQAMEVLGLGTVDLLQPQNLIELVQELTGSVDASALLTNGNFQLTMQEVTGLISEFQQENGFNAAQFSDLLEQLSAQIDEMEQAVREFLNIDEGTQSVQASEVQADGWMEESQPAQVTTEQVPQTGQELVTAAEQQHPAVQPVQKEAENTSEQIGEQPVSMTEEPTKEAAQISDQEKNPASQDGKNKQQTDTFSERQDSVTAEHHTGIFRENPVMTSAQTVTAAPETPLVSSYVDVEQLMDQMEGLARSFISAEGTTVEMQLNPESLGRLVLTVTEKHGNVTAQITASNEQVKETLQTQLAELHSTLQAQGVKVEAVEVTVATHEFEQNLDGNASANGQMQEQTGEQRSGGQNERRNLNINSLDELSGLMSEEETLVAQMMRDNGGTVDYTA